jgi:membrane-associated phospholipid phosphatase
MVRLLAAAVALAVATPTAASDREVYTIRPAVDAAVIAVSAATSLTLTLLEDRIIDPRCPCDRGEVPRFERFAIDYDSDAAARVSDVTLLLALAVPPVAGLARLGPSGAFLQDATVFAESLAVTGALTAIVKNAAQRPIPRAYAGDPAAIGDANSYRSFFSGHTSLTFAALTTTAWTIRLRHGEQIWPWVVAGVVGASVGLERVLAGRHFPTDVLAGAFTGIAVGTAVPLLHERSAGNGGASLLATPRGISIAGRL